MNTAKQAMENMEYVRGKPAGFAASAELAPFFIHRQIEWSEETMEVTLPPGRHEAVERQVPTGMTTATRCGAGAAGCPPWLALRILR